MAIPVVTPPDWDMKVDDRWDGVQISPLGLLWIKDHIESLYPEQLTAHNTIMHFPSSHQIKILEVGTGHSGAFFATIFPTVQVCSIEGEKMWYERELEWQEKKKLFNWRIIFEEQPSDYGFDSLRDDNMNYINRAKEFGFPFDLILNDGGMREKVADVILSDADKWLSIGGVYLRHDYNRAVSERWIGPHISPHPPWVVGEVGTFYEQFCALHPNYRTITTPGNWVTGLYEYGGVWRIK